MMKVQLYCDTTKYKCKPKDLRAIRGRIASSSPQDFSPIGIKSAIESGMTIMPAVVKPSRNDNGNLTHKSENFENQRLFGVDIDNAHENEPMIDADGNPVLKENGKPKMRKLTPDEGYITPAQAIEICELYGIKPFFMYHTFSSTTDFEKFRIFVILDELVTDNKERYNIVAAFISLFGRAADTACTDAVRVFHGGKPECSIYFKQDATTPKSVFLDIWQTMQEIEADAKQEVQRASNSLNAYENAKNHGYDADPTVLLNMMNPNALKRAEWMKVSAAYKNAGGDNVQWLTWCSQYTTDDPKEDVKLWETVGKAGQYGKAGIGTLKYYAKQYNPNGYQNYIDDLNAQQRAARPRSAATDSTKTATNRTSFQFGIEWDGDTLNEENFRRYLKQKGYVLRFNSIAHKVEYQGVTGIAPEHLGNAFPMMVYNDLHRELSRVSPKICGSYVNLIANKDEFNPALDAINAVTWDGENHLETLYAILKIPTDDKLSRTFLRKWLMQGYCLQFNTLESPIAPEFVLVLHGAQGIGKTTLFTKLSIKPNLACVGHDLDTTDKDSVIQATSAFICELGEVKRTTKRDSDALKAFITSTYDEIRVPYAAAAERQPRRTNFCATTNDEHFLADDTGNRRWGVIPLESMTREDTQAILAMKYSEIIQVWAQVKHIVDTAIQNGSTYANCFRLTQEERKKQELRNGRFLNLVTAQMEIEDILAAVEKSPTDYEWKEETLTEWRKWYSCLDKYSVEKISRALKAAGLSPAHPAKRDGKNVRLRSLPFPKHKPGTQMIELKTSSHALEK